MHLFVRKNELLFLRRIAQLEIVRDHDRGAPQSDHGRTCQGSARQCMPAPEPQQHGDAAQSPGHDQPVFGCRSEQLATLHGELLRGRGDLNDGPAREAGGEQGGDQRHRNREPHHISKLRAEQALQAQARDQDGRNRPAHDRAGRQQFICHRQAPRSAS